MTPPENAIEAQMAGKIKMPAKAGPGSRQNSQNYLDL